MPTMQKSIGIERRALARRNSIAAHAEANEAMKGMVWSHPSILNSWYRNPAGRVTVLSPWRLLDYWRWTKRPDLADFTLT